MPKKSPKLQFSDSSVIDPLRLLLQKKPLVYDGGNCDQPSRAHRAAAQTPTPQQSNLFDSRIVGGLSTPHQWESYPTALLHTQSVTQKCQPQSPGVSDNHTVEPTRSSKGGTPPAGVPTEVPPSFETGIDVAQSSHATLGRGRHGHSHQQEQPYPSTLITENPLAREHGHLAQALPGNSVITKSLVAPRTPVSIPKPSLSATSAETPEPPVSGTYHPATFSNELHVKPSRSPTSSSSLSVFTQSVLGHARDLQAFARNAASSLLSSTGRTPFWDDVDGGFGQLEGAWFPPPFCRDEGHFTLCDNTSAFHSNTHHISSDTRLPCVKQNVPVASLTTLPFDPRLPYFGKVQSAWVKDMSHLPTFCRRVIKCPSCWNLFLLFHDGAHETLRWCPILPQHFVTRPLKRLDDTARTSSNLMPHISLFPTETVNAVLTTVWALWENVPPIAGKLISTSYRILFEADLIKTAPEVTVGTQWMHLCNFWEVPLGAIDKIVHASLSAREKSYLVSHFLTDIKATFSDMESPHSLGAVTPDRPTQKQSSHQPSSSICVENFLHLLRNSVSPPSITSLFAFTPTQELILADSFEYSPIEEWSRLLTRADDWLRVSRVNTKYEACPTYPKLVVVPRLITDDQLLKVAAFRSKQRFPILSWVGPMGFGCLWRCSQPKSMFQRCVEDELFLSIIAESSHMAQRSRDKTGCRVPPMLIIDARPLINAMVNKASGAGFENTTSYYRRCRIEFGNIDNIHHVRDAWKKMASAISGAVVSACALSPLATVRPEATFNNTGVVDNCPVCQASLPHSSTTHDTSSSTASLPRLLSVDPREPFWCYGPPTPPLAVVPAGTCSSLYQSIAQSRWYDYIQYILRATGLAVSRLHQGEPVLIHCSDGWDRTAQLTSLTMLCMDPYYRTLRGFAVLVEQEFLHAGHPFHLRSGHPGHFITPRPYDSNSEDTAHGTSVGTAETYDDDVSESDTTEDGERIHRSRHQESPIFLQWLDCVSQLIRQFPTAFEFNIAFLDFLSSELYACYYGTFLMNSSKERDMIQLQARTLSVWTAVFNEPSRFTNTSYLPAEENTNEAIFTLPFPLYPDPCDIYLWNTYWFRYRPQGLRYIAESVYDAMRPAVHASILHP